ncbi:MAG TPA: BatA domain-containing protein [Steroidobacteraceae bacterium]|jgi:hypothetical protein|nr:BatA domain-containing protein [Steroidobacteraceae bacterium]
MSLLAPLFLAGLAAIALPLWLHRLRSRQAQRAPFSSAMLLEHSPQQQLLRKRWRYLTLLGLRVLLLAALCFAFAQPQWHRAVARHAARAGLQLIVLDTSLSMGADGRFARARAAAQRLIDRLDGARALIVSASDGLAVSSAAGAGGGPSADPAALRAVLRQLHPTAARLDDGAAMAGLDSVFDRQRGEVEAYFISDFQASGAPTRFADLLPQLVAGRALALQLQPVAGAAVPANWAVSALRRDGDDLVVTVRGFNTPARVLGVTLEINGKPATASATATQLVGASAAAQFRFVHPLLRQGDNRVIARLAAGDALAADNVRYAVIRDTPVQPVPVLSADPGARAAKYLATALAATGGGYQAQVLSLGSFDARTLPRYRWIVLDDLGAVDATLAAQLQTFIANGGAVFAALGQRSATTPRLPLLGDRITGGAGGTVLSVGQLQANHPLLSGLRGWESLTIGHMLVLAPDPADDVLVSASNGAPLLLERRLGRGRLLLYTSDLNDDGNDLPVQPLFVGLLAQLGRYLGGQGELAPVQTVGASIALGRGGGPAGQVIDPSGRTVLSLADTRRALTVKLDQPGFYQIYTPAGEALVAVNPDLRESDLAPMPAVELSRWRSALAAQRAVPVAAQASSTNDPTIPLAPVLLGLLAALALAESLLGNSYLHRRLTAGAGRS